MAERHRELWNIFIVICFAVLFLGVCFNQLDPKNYPTNQKSDNDKNKGLGIYTPVDPEKIPKSTSTADPKPGEIWIITWDRGNLREKGDVNPDLRRQSKPWKIVAWSKYFIKMETEYFDYDEKQKAYYEWDKSKNPEFGTWYQTRPKIEGIFRLNKESDGSFSGWSGEKGSKHRIPLWLRRQ